MSNEKIARYNVIGFYPKHNDWFLICLGSKDKAEAEKKLEKVKADPKYYGVNIFDSNEVSEFALEPIFETEEQNAWWNK